MLLYFYAYIEPSRWASHFEHDCPFSHFILEKSEMKKILHNSLAKQRILDLVLSELRPRCGIQIHAI